MTRTTALNALLLVCLLAACGAPRDDSGAMMGDGAGMMEDSARMDEPMGFGAISQPGMEDDSSTGEMMEDDSAMARDTSEMRRP